MGHSRGVKIVLPLKSNHYAGLQTEVQRAEQDYGVVSGTWWDNTKGMGMLASKPPVPEPSLSETKALEVIG